MVKLQAPPGYQIGKSPGKDRTGVLFLARQLKLDRPVTMKVYRAPDATKPRAAETVSREIEMLLGLTHAHLLSTLDSGQVDQHRFLIVESIALPNLETELAEGKAFDEKRAIAVASGIAKALVYLEKKELTLRSFNPRYVFLAEPDIPKLYTFRQLRRSDEGERLREVEAQPALYCAPEYLRLDLGYVTPKANVYALGVLLMHMLSGSPPVQGDDDEVRAVHEEDRFPSLRSKVPFARAKAVETVEALTRYAPDERPDPAEALALLDSYARDPGLQSNTGGAPRSRRKRVRRRRR